MNTLPEVVELRASKVGAGKVEIVGWMFCNASALKDDYKLD